MRPPLHALLQVAVFVVGGLVGGPGTWVVSQRIVMRLYGLPELDWTERPALVVMVATVVAMFAFPIIALFVVKDAVVVRCPRCRARMRCERTVLDRRPSRYDCTSCRLSGSAFELR